MSDLFLRFMRKNILRTAILVISSFILLMVYQNCAKVNLYELESVDTELASSLPIADCPLEATVPNQLAGTCLSLLETKSFQNLRSYQPRYQLYSEAALKQRWIYLPKGSQINTQDPDNWIYPVGTILWKEFSLDGLKIETRMLEKVSDGQGQDSWRNSVYLWNQDQTRADLTTTGRAPSPDTAYALELFSNRYDVPSTNTCVQCHGGSKDMALGFTYLQLSNNNKSNVTINYMRQNSWFTHALMSADEIAGTVVDKEAIGYMQANCVHCHNPQGSASFMDLKHKSGITDRTQEPAYKNTVNVNQRVVPGFASSSKMYQRFNAMEMPPAVLPRYTVDNAGGIAIMTWINNISVTTTTTTTRPPVTTTTSTTTTTTRPPVTTTTSTTRPPVTTTTQPPVTTTSTTRPPVTTTTSTTRPPVTTTSSTTTTTTRPPVTTTTTTSTTTTTIPAVTYTYLRDNVFSRCTQCHSGSNPPLGFSVETYAQTITRLVKFDSANSKIYLRVSSTDTSFRMPRNQTPLTAVQINEIKRWIDSGAPNN